MKINFVTFLALAAFTAASTAFADEIELKNGEKLTGSMSRQGSVMIIKTDDGRIISAKPEDVLRVTLTGSASPVEVAASEWKRLNLQIKSADDLRTIIDLHEKFLVKFPDSAQADEVRSSQRVYQKLSESGGVKFRGRWMPRAQIEVLIKQWADAARPAADLYRAGRFKDALDAAKSALANDEQNPDALTVGGLSAYRLNSLPQARTYFTALITADPSTVLAENNLAVVSVQQKQPGESLVHYDRALQLAPDNRFVLDNVTEALYAYAGDKNATNYRNLIRTYDAAETRMESEMAKKGLQRWGSSWVTLEQADTMRKTHQAVQDQMIRLDAQYLSVRESINSFDVQIKEAAASFESYQNDYNSYTLLLQYASTNSNTDVVNLAISRDAAWQNMERISRYKASLEARRNQIVASAAPFYTQAEKLKATFAATQAFYSGTQRVLDLGEVENPPPPMAVPIPKLPASGQAAGTPPPTVVVVPQAPPIPPPAIIPVPVPVPVNNNPH